MGTVIAGYEQNWHLDEDQVKRVVVSAAGNGNNTLVEAVASKKIKLLSLVLVAASAVNVRLESGASGTALTGVMSLTANGGLQLILPPVPPGYHWVETAAGVLLNLELGGAVQVSGVLTYIVE